MDNVDIMQLSNKDLHDNLRDERALLQKLKFGHAVSPIENPKKISASKKLIARFLTEMTRRRKLAKEPSN